MTNFRKKWSGTESVLPEPPDLVLSRLTHWQPDNSRKYSTLNGYEPNNITAAVAWHKIPNDLIASDAFIYKDKKTGLWVQAVGYPLITRELSKSWIDLQMANGAVQYWTNQYAHPRLPQRPYTQRETPGKVIDQISYIEIIALQNKFTVNGINMLDFNPLGQPKDLDVYAKPKPRPVYQKRNTGVFHIKSNSRCLETPKGVYFSISSAAADMGVSFNGVTHHLKKNTPGYRYITQEEYLQRLEELNKNSTTE